MPKTLTNAAALNHIAAAARGHLERFAYEDNVDAASLAHAIAKDAVRIRDMVLAGRPDDGSREPPWLTEEPAGEPV